MRPPESAQGKAAATAAAKAEDESRTPFLLDGSVFGGASAFAAEPLGYQTVMRGYDRFDPSVGLGFPAAAAAACFPAVAAAAGASAVAVPSMLAARQQQQMVLLPWLSVCFSVCY